MNEVVDPVSPRVDPVSPRSNWKGAWQQRVPHKFKKIFRKNNDNNLLKYFFGNDENIFRYVNNFISYDYKIECKEINIEPIMNYINEWFNTKLLKSNYSIA